MTDNDESLVNEIVNYLKSDREDIQKSALEAILSISTDSKKEKYLLKNEEGIPTLLRLINHPGKVGYLSLASLLHMASSSDSKNCDEFLSKLNYTKTINRLIETGLSYHYTDEEKENREHVHHAMSLLSNISRKENCVDYFENEKEKEKNKVKIKLLLARFFSEDFILKNEIEVANSNNEANEELADEFIQSLPGYVDPFQHVSSYLLNITQYPTGRQFILESTKKSSSEDNDSIQLPTYIQSILNQLRTSQNVLRRRNAAGIIKNVCIENNESISSWFKSASDSIHNIDNDLIFNLLYPFMTGDANLLVQEHDDERVKILVDDLYLNEWVSFDKVREADWETRLILVDTILILCSYSRSLRETLRSRGTYYILRNADLMEEKEEISDKILDCVQFLKRDEEAMDEGSSDRIAFEIAQERRDRWKRELEEEQKLKDVD